MVSIPPSRRGTGRPSLPHDKKERRFVAVAFLCILLFTILYDNELNVNRSVDRELVNLAQSKQQQEKQQQPADVPRNNSSSLTASTLLHRPLSPLVKVHKLSPSLKSCPNTVVTAYFQVRSKHKDNDYLKWMKNMLSIQDCMVVLTSSSMVETIKSLRQHAMDGTVILEMEVDDLPIAHLHGEQPEFWPHQLKIDREKKLHKSHQLFWIWLSKTWFVVQAIQKEYFHSSFYMWQDIGSYRVEKYNGKMIIQHPEIVPDGTLLWMAHHPPNPPKSGPIWNDKWNEKVHYFHSGSNGAGAKKVWIEYHGHFAEVMDQFIERNMFIGEDQCVMQGTCQKYPDLCAYIPAKDVRDHSYFGLRYALHHGHQTPPWRMPGAKNQTNRR